MKKTVPAVMAALALVALPVAGAQAKPSGKAERERAAERQSGERGKSKRCKKPSRRGFVVRGSLAGYDTESVTLDVQRANKHARRWLRDNDPTFDTSDARFAFDGVEDATGDGVVNLDDVVSTDRVRVIGKLAVPKRGCDGDTTLTIRKVAVTREVEEEEQEVAEQS